MLRAPEALQRLDWAEDAPQVGAGCLAALLKRLEADVRACVAADGVYSPLCDVRRRVAGAWGGGGSLRAVDLVLMI